MSSEFTRRLFTYDDCLRMAEAGVLSPLEKIELIHGELFVVSPPGPRHGAAVDATSAAMIQILHGKAIVRTQGAVVLDKFAAPMPDIALLRPRDDFYVRKNPDAADILLIVEVASSSLELDTTVKLQLYAIMGIPQYWVADLVNDRLMVHTDPVEDKYQVIREFRRGVTVAPHLLPECKISADLLLP